MITKELGKKMVAFQKELLTIVGSILFFWASLYTKSVMKTTPKFKEKSTTWYENYNLPTKWDIQYHALVMRKDVRVSKPWCEDRLDQLPLLVDLNSQMKMVTKSKGQDGLVVNLHISSDLPSIQKDLVSENNTDSLGSFPHKIAHILSMNQSV